MQQSASSLADNGRKNLEQLIPQLQVRVTVGGAAEFHCISAGAIASELCPADPYSAERQSKELAGAAASAGDTPAIIQLRSSYYFPLSVATAAAHLSASASSTKTYYGRHFKIFLDVFVN
jgi:hypothetical protein